MVVINVNHLSKNYGDVKAVDDISFAVDKGEIFGVIGPNGAGKTGELLHTFSQPSTLALSLSLPTTVGNPVFY